MISTVTAYLIIKLFSGARSLNGIIGDGSNKDGTVFCNWVQNSWEPSYIKDIVKLCNKSDLFNEGRE